MAGFSNLRAGARFVGQVLQGQLAAVEKIPRAIVDPVARSIALAPIDDEPLTDEDIRRIRAGREYAANGGKGTSLEEVLAEFGLTMEDFPLER